jgi:predicted transcriptional regulator
MSTKQKPLSLDHATLPAGHEPTPEVRAWQADKIEAGLKDADAGRFASPDSIKAVIQKFIRNG